MAGCIPSSPEDGHHNYLLDLGTDDQEGGGQGSRQSVYSLDVLVAEASSGPQGSC